MAKKNMTRFAIAGVAFWAMLTLAVSPFGWAGPQGAGAATLAGIVYEQNLNTPVENAVVKIRNLATRKEYQSMPTGKGGDFLIQGIEEGRYSLGVKTNDGDFNFEFELFLKGGEAGKVSLALKPGASAVVAGRKSKKTPFFLTPLGLVTAVGTAGTAGAVVYNAVKSEPSSVSPGQR